MSLLPKPHDIGLPATKFPSWQKDQERAVLAGLDSRKRHVVVNAPTGFGKSVVYMGQALLSRSRTAFLTVSKGLQSQLLRDFESIGLVDVRGRANHPCKELMIGGSYRGQGVASGEGCDAGPCLVGAHCHLRFGGCYYFDSVRQARAAKLVVTNYSYWIAQHRYSDGLGEFDLLVLDEADDAPDEIAAALEIELRPGEFLTELPASDESEVWRRWATREHVRLEAKLAELEELDGKKKLKRFSLRQIYALKGILRKLAVLIAMQGRWVLERTDDGAKIAPVWAAPYAEELLFRGIKKVVLVSATITEKTLQGLGLKRGEYDFFEYPSSFPVARRPVIQIPTVRCRHGWSVAEQKTWLTRIDQIIDRRLDRKGIIHTVSYERAKLLLEYSDHRELMIANRSGNTRQMVDQFKAATPPAILVSPSLTSGWDLPFEACEYAIIAKIPFPDTRSKITKARTEEDPEYGPYLAMLTIVQASGRGMRSAEDQCEILIVDDMFVWFWAKFKQFAPRWFQNAVRRAVTIPDPLPKLKKETIYG